MTQRLNIIRKNEKWGISDQGGKTICNPIYDHISYIKKYDSFVVKKDGKYGLLDKHGSVLADTIYQQIAPYKIDPHDSNMGEGYEITQDTGLGWLSLDGKEILSPVYKQFKRIGNILVVDSPETTYESIYSIDGKKLNESKKIRISDVNGDYIEVHDGEKQETYLLDKDGNTYISSIEDGLFIYKFVPGKPIAAKQKSSDKWGFIDREGKVIIDFQFDDLYFENEIPFTQQYTRVGIDGKMGIIDEKGKFILPTEYEALASPQESSVFFLSGNIDGYLDYNNKSYYLQFDETEQKFLYKNKDGKRGHIQHIKDAVEMIENSVYIEHKGKWGMLDGENNLIVDTVYDEISPTFCGKLAFVRKDKKYAFLHREKGLITDFIYEDALFLMKDYGLGVVNGLYALINNDGQLTEARFSEIGTPVDRAYYYYGDNKIPACGGIWDYAVLPSTNEFLTKDFEHVISRNYENYTQLNQPDEYSSQPYFKAFDAKDNKFVMILEDGNIKDLPVSINPIDPVFNTYIAKPMLKEKNLPNYIIEQKIIGAKNKINPKYDSIDDYYYMNGSHSKVLKSMQGYTNRFCHTLGIAVSYWVMARLHESVNKYINLQYAYDRLEAFYLFGIDYDLICVDELTEDWLITRNNEIEKAMNGEEVNEADRTCIDALDTLGHLYSSSIRYGSIYRPSYYKNTASLIVLARLTLAGAKKDLFNKWLDDKLQQGRELYSSSVTYDEYPHNGSHGSYYLYADKFVPLEFFFDNDFKKDTSEDIDSIKRILEQADWENNPYLIKEEYEKFKTKGYII